MKCPNCNNKIKIFDKFCKYCATPLSEYKTERFKYFVRMTAIAFFALFLIELGYNMIYEKAQERPFSIETKLGDTNATVNMTIENQEGFSLSLLRPKNATIELLLDEKIENWQIEELKTKYATANLQVNKRNNDLNVTSRQTELKAGDKLKYTFYVSDTNIVEYVRVKKAFKNANYSLSSSDCLSPEISVRQKAKKAYEERKERERKERARQAQLERERQQYLQQLRSYYDYDYGYYYY